MNILFVCRANIGRSQMAMEFYNQIPPGCGESAGTIVDQPGQKIGERPGAVNVIDAMRQYGIDMSGNTRRQITEQMIEKFDKVIVMDKPETIPDWLTKSPKTEVWLVEDPKAKDVETTTKIVEQIHAKVRSLTD